ncbi:hypothetical protein G7043_41160 [Lentzea sp. NEAU-D13]|uniref:Uncharacterized protein n=1 Tax=Lentzea alba TaxID=2714351 RepID=A0A7C9RXI0_9PSEU|nr:hypothetical protein [Lentzea alba]NGY65324.1 hypothetical protein [Lentzea alba]
MPDEFLFEFEGAPAERDRDARDLIEWLEEDLRGCLSLRMIGPAEGELGGAADAVIVLAAAVPLSRPFFTWLTERAKARRVKLRISVPHRGEQLKIDVEGPVDAEALLDRIAQILDED